VSCTTPPSKGLRYKKYNVEDVREWNASLERENFSIWVYLNGISSSLSTFMIGFDCKSVRSTLGIVLQSKPASLALLSSSKQGVNYCIKNGMHCVFIYSPWVNWASWSFFSFKICKPEISSKTYSWLGDRRKSQQFLE
jgi:hypothetical protein